MGCILTTQSGGIWSGLAIYVYHTPSAFPWGIAYFCRLAWRRQEYRCIAILFWTPYAFQEGISYALNAMTNV